MKLRLQVYSKEIKTIAIMGSDATGQTHRIAGKIFVNLTYICSKPRNTANIHSLINVRLKYRSENLRGMRTIALDLAYKHFSRNSKNITAKIRFSFGSLTLSCTSVSTKDQYSRHIHWLLLDTATKLS